MKGVGSGRYLRGSELEEVEEASSVKDSSIGSIGLVNGDIDEEPEADLAVEVMDGTVTLDDGKPVEISNLDLVEKENKIEGSSNFSDIEQYMNHKDDGSYDKIF